MGEPKVQVYIYGKGTPKEKVVLRSARKNIEEPSEAQLETRARFGEAAAAARGRRFDGEVPPAAEAVREQLKGQTVPEAMKRPQRLKVWEQELLALLRKMVGRPVPAKEEEVEVR